MEKITNARHPREFKITEESRLPFGKHKGEQIKDVPASYLLWCLEAEFIHNFEDIRDYISENQEELEAQAKDEEGAWKGGKYKV